MKTYILDAIVIKEIEKEIGRKFTTEELDYARNSEGQLDIFDEQTQTWHSFNIPIYEFPNELTNHESNEKDEYYGR